MSSTSSPQSPLDEKSHGFQFDGFATGSGLTTDSGRLHALEQLEVLPQILQEGIVFSGAGTALLLQAAMPGIEESGASPHDLQTELVDSLQANISYISCLVFGDRAERRTLLELLSRGETPGLGGGRSNRFAHYPDLQLWMGATLYATSVDFFQRVWGQVDFDTAQRSYSEYSLLMNCLGLPPGTWPETRQAFWQWWDITLDQKLVVSSGAAQFAADLRESQEMPNWVLKIKPYLRAVTVETLPPRLRNAYGLESTKGTRFRYSFWMFFSKALYLAMPCKWRSYPLQFYHDRLRSRMNVV